MTRRGVLITLALMAAAAVVVSLTVGRDLYQGRSPTFTSFVLLHFAGYLVFLIMPVELLAPWYLAEGHGGPEVLGLAVVTASLAHVVDYGIGRLVSEDVVAHVIGARRFRRAYDRVERWGTWALLTVSLLPLSSPAVLVAAGVVRYGLVRSMLWSTAGLLGKYTVIVLILAP